MSEAISSRAQAFLTGSALGAVFGFVVKELQLTMLVSYWGERSILVLTASLLGGVIGLTSLKKFFGAVVAATVVLWLAVGFTPLTDWMARDLARRDPPQKADAVFVLASNLQSDGELTTSAMSRLLGGLRLLGEGWTSRLILSELPGAAPSYGDAARRLMKQLGIEHEILRVGPVRSTHDEAVAVAELARKRGFTHVLVVTSPSHSRRAAESLEAQGLAVTSVPATEVEFDYENLGAPFSGDDHILAFGELIHEHVGLFYYRLRGWIQ